MILTVVIRTDVTPRKGLVGPVLHHFQLPAQYGEAYNPPIRYRWAFWYDSFDVDPL